MRLNCRNAVHLTTVQILLQDELLSVMRQVGCILSVQ